MALSTPDATNVIAVATNIATATNDVVATINGLVVVNQVKDFFSTAYTQTIWLVGTLITILGFAIPAIYFVLAKIQLKIREKKLEDKFEGKFKELKKKLNGDITALYEKEQASIEAKFKELESKVENESHTSRANVFQVLSVIAQEQGDHKGALSSHMRQLKALVAAKNTQKIQLLLRYILKHVVKKLDKNNFNDEEFLKEIEKTLKSARQVDVLLEIDVDALSEALAEAKKREEKK